MSLLPLFVSVCKAPTMHPLFSQASEMNRDIIGAAIEVHQDKGPGLLEPIHEWCLTINFNELKRTDGVSRLILPGANLE
jgi:hypothetical protein